MTSLVAVSLFAVFCAFLLRIFEEFAPRFKSYLLIGAGIVFFLLFAKWTFPLLEKLRTVASKTSIPDYFLLLIKAMGLSLVVSIASSFCRDLGEEGIANKLELCAKGAILALSLPIFSSVLNWIGELLS